MRKHLRFLARLAVLGLFLAISALGQEQKTPRTAGEWNVAGMGLGMLDRWPEAVEAFKQAIRLEPDFVEAHNNLGFAYAALARSQDAIKAYEAAIKVKPEFAAAYFNLGFAYAGSGRLQDALSTFRQAIKFSPGWDEAQYHLGLVCLQLGLWADAAEAFNQVLNPEPAGEGGKTRSGDKDTLQEGFFTVNLAPEKYLVFSNLAYADAKLGRYEDAIAAYEQSIQLKPNNPDAHYNLGETYVLSQKRDGALKEYETLKKLEKKKAEKLRKLIDKAKQ